MIILGEIPPYMDGEKSFEPEKRLSILEQVSSIDKLVRSLESYRSISITERNKQLQCRDIVHQIREVDQGLFVFVCSMNRKERRELTIELMGIEKPEQVQYWCAISGTQYNYQFQFKDSKVIVDLSLPPVGSALLHLTKIRKPLPEFSVEKSENVERLTLPDNYSYELEDYNVLVLDKPACHAGSEQKEFRGQDEILRVDSMLRKEFGYPLRGDSMKQPWTQANKSDSKERIDIVLEYNFDVDIVPEDSIFLGIEQAQRWTISLNGKELSNQIVGWWVDPAIDKVQIPNNLIRKGLNTLAISASWDTTLELEIIYLLGNFGIEIVENKTKLIKLPHHLKTGSWLNQGLPFYSGNIKYKTSFHLDKQNSKKYLLGLDQCRCSVCEISLNNNISHIIAFPNQRIDITDNLINGTNEILIRVFSSRKNAFGPLHLDDPKPFVIGPFSFRDGPTTPQVNEFRLSEYGIMDLICFDVCGCS